jgi:hypothetical protein
MTHMSVEKSPYSKWSTLGQGGVFKVKENFSIRIEESWKRKT